MTIECDYCYEEVWCLRYNDEWVCKECFNHELHKDDKEWWDLNKEAKRKRDLKRMQEFDDSHINI